MYKLEQETHETIQYFLPRIAVALENIAAALDNLAKEKKRENDLKEKCLTKK